MTLKSLLQGDLKHTATMSHKTVDKQARHQMEKETAL